MPSNNYISSLRNFAQWCTSESAPLSDMNLLQVTPLTKDDRRRKVRLERVGKLDHTFDARSGSFWKDTLHD